MIEAKFKRHFNEGTKELLDLLVYNGEWWQVGNPDDNGICETWVYGEPSKTMMLKEVWKGVGRPIDGEYDSYDLVGYEIQ